jgi:predicted alpha/beta-hydrolase family hydrolase
MALYHGAGSNCESPLMVAVAEAFCAAGFLVLREDLPRGSAQRDRAAIRKTAEELRGLAPGVPLCLAGHSYGGRQCSMLAAEDPSVADALLLLSYPLHPPRKPEELRTGHFGQLKTPALFVHGTRDPFGTVAEMEAAIETIPGAHVFVAMEGEGHGIKPKKTDFLPEALSAMMKLG